MLLANSSVSGKAATGHVLMYAPTGGFPRILALHPKALRQIGNPWFFGMNSGSVYEPLMWEVRFFAGNGEGIEVLAEPIFVRAQPFNGSGTAARSSHAGFASSLRGISHVRLAYFAPCFAAVLPLAGRLMGGQKGKCPGVAQYCVDYENSEYYCGNRRPAEEFGEEVRYRKNREENHRERVLREGFSQVAAQQRMEGAQGSASRAVEACQRVCRARRKNRRR